MEKPAKKVKLSDFDKMEIDFTTVHSRRMNEIMVTCDDEDFAVLFYKGMEYFKPKLQRSEIIEEKKEQVITIVHVSPDSLDKDNGSLDDE